MTERSRWLAGLVVAVTAAGGCSAGGGQLAARADPPRTTDAPAEAAPPSAIESVLVAPAPASPSPPSTPPPSTPPPTPGGLVPLAVRSVTDGDTLVLADGRRVRLAQVDAPETGECFGSQSAQALRTLVEGRMVTVRRPSNGPELDRYGRTVAEVSVADRSVNEQLVRDGAAEWHQEFAREDAGLAGRLGAAEADAKGATRGLWSGCPTSSPAPTPLPQKAATSPRGTCHPAYPDDCILPGPPDLDCPDIKRSVRVDHRHGDPHRFDADRIICTQ